MTTRGLKENDFIKIANMIHEKSANYNCLIMDFIGWENTYYIALNSNVRHSDIVIKGGAKNSPIPIQQIENKIKEEKIGAVVLQSGSILYNKFLNKDFNLNVRNLEVNNVYDKEGIVVCEFYYK